MGKIVEHQHVVLLADVVLEGLVVGDGVVPVQVVRAFEDGVERGGDTRARPSPPASASGGGAWRASVPSAESVTAPVAAHSTPRVNVLT